MPARIAQLSSGHKKFALSIAQNSPVSSPSATTVAPVTQR